MTIRLGRDEVCGGERKMVVKCGSECVPSWYWKKLAEGDHLSVLHVTEDDCGSATRGLAEGREQTSSDRRYMGE